MVLDAHVGHARQRRERGDRDGVHEAQLHLVVGEVPQRLGPVDLDEAAVADDRDAVAGPLDLGQDVAGQEHRAALRAGLADQLVERLLDQRVEARRRLVQDQQVRPVLERDDQADLLLVALGQLLELAARVDVQPLDERSPGTPRRRRRGGWRSTGSSGRRSGGRRARTRPGCSRSGLWIETGSTVVSMSNTNARPDVGRIRSSSVRMVVVLPAPLGPRKPKISFSATSRSTSLMPRWAPYALVRRSVRMMLVMLVLVR